MIIFFTLAIILDGCSCKQDKIEIVKTVEVKVPVKCTAPSCNREPYLNHSDKSLSIVERAKAKEINYINAESYIKCLEASNQVCK